MRDCKCDGSGTIRYEHVDRDDGGNVVARTLGTHLCSCRRNQPPRDGDAAWWTTETAHHEVFDGVLFTAEVSVSPEVPVSSEGFRVHRRGNRYYPTDVCITFDREEAPLINHDEAERFIAFLQRAVDKAREIDAADCDPCGHWHPCDCEARDDS